MKKMKLKNVILMLLFMSTVAIFSSCGGGEDEIVNLGEAISGTYSGTLTIFETGETENGYIKLERASNTTVFLNLLYCEKLGVEIEENYELIITEDDDKQYKLQSGSNYLISGSVRDEELTLNVKIGNNTYIFDGDK